MFPTRTRVLAVLLAVTLVVPLAVGPATGAAATAVSDESPATSSGAFEPAASETIAPATPPIAAQTDDRPDNPTTSETIGYVDGYWYDDALPVDDRDGAHVPEEELQAVVYRSMARVETIRERTFETTPDVEVITREEFQNDTGVLFGNITERDELLENVRYEALFMVDRERDAVEAYKELYGGSVAGYYEPSTDQIVLVSNDLESVEVNENTLAHELVHALQDQLFGLEDFDRSTTNKDVAVNGLVEGDASFVDRQYTERCQAEWTCLVPETDQPGMEGVSWGQYFSMFMPYDEGPSFVEHVYDEGGWAAVDARYESDVPASASEIIHPGTDREPIDLDIEDRSSEKWSPLAINDSVSRLTMGEGTIVSMFADGTVTDEPSVLSANEFLTMSGDLRYDQPISDGWAGGEMVVYTTDAETVTESGFVWQTEWTDADDASEFRDGYLDLLSLHDAEPVDGVQNTLRIDEAYPGSYAIEQDGETVTIVRAPTTAELSEIHEGTAPDGEHTIDHSIFGDAGSESGDGESESGDESASGGDDSDDDPIPGFGVLAAVIGTLLAVAVRHRR